MRSFVAMDLSEEIRHKIEEIQMEFENIRRSAKFVDAKQAHITLKFLGEIPWDDIEKIKEALNEVNFRKFGIELRGVGSFPEVPLQKAKKIRVLWIGVEKGVEELKELQEDVESRLTILGFPAEKRFSAHVTICRLKNISMEETEKVLKKIARIKEVYIGRMNVEEIKLKKSTLTPKGPIYEDVYVKGLL